MMEQKQKNKNSERLVWKQATDIKIRDIEIMLVFLIAFMVITFSPRTQKDWLLLIAILSANYLWRLASMAWGIYQSGDYSIQRRGDIITVYNFNCQKHQKPGDYL